MKRIENVLNKDLSRKQENFQEKKHFEKTKHSYGMPIYEYPCGQQILIVPYENAVNKAMKNHLPKHRNAIAQKLREKNSNGKNFETVSRKYLRLIFENKLSLG